MSKIPCKETIRIADRVKWFLAKNVWDREQRQSLENLYAEIKSKPENYPDVDIDNPDTIISYLRTKIKNERSGK